MKDLNKEKNVDWINKNSEVIFLGDFNAEVGQSFRELIRDVFGH